MTSKERARLRGLANGMETVLQIGKDGIGENLIHQADITLEARELMKGRVLDGCIFSPREAAEMLAQATDSEVVQVIGSTFALYRKKKSAETEKKASKPRNPERRKKPSPAPRDIFPKGGDASGKAGKRFRALSNKERSGAKTVQRDKKRSAETAERNKKRSPAPMGRGTGEGASRPNAFGKSRQGVKSGDAAPAQRKAVGPGRTGGGQRKPFSRPGPRKARDGGNRRK